jgi:uncharacterized protein (TIGR03118 family)
MVWRRRARRSTGKLRQHGLKAQGRFSLERLEDRQLLTASGYQQVNLVSDQAGAALVRDPNLVNPYGIALANGSGDIWVANAGSNTLTRYDGAFAGSAFAQDLPTVSAPSGVQGPTGIVWDTNGAFIFNQQNPAPFLFASQNGQISLVPSLTASQAAAGTSAAPNSFYTGLALVVNGAATNLYAANFSAGTVDGFDHNLAPIPASSAFVDPNLPSGYSPYNIQALSVGGTQLVFVAYAPQDPNNHQHAVPGAGHGLIDVYGVDGSFKAELIKPSEGHLNAPWGMAMAPSSTTFGDLAGDLLVANADGTISAYSVTNASGTLGQSFVSTLNDSSSAPIHIDGLHGLAFGNGASTGNVSTLFFSAAPNSGTHGLVGELVNAFDNPIAAQGTNITATGGVAFSGAVAAFTPQAALAGDAFTATIHWGDGASGAGSVTSNGSGGFVVSGSHSYTQLGAVTPLTVDIVDTSTAGATASTTGSAVVIDGNISATAVAVSTTEGAALSAVPVATFTDPGGQASTAFTATIDWGDGSTVDAGAVSGSNGTFTVKGSHTYATQGTFNGLTVRISEGAATPTPIAVTATATVADSDTLTATGSPVSATEGTTFSGQVATFTDTYTVTPAASFTATIHWGDGASVTVTPTGANGAFTVSGSHVYADESSQAISVSIAETGAGATASATATTTATVAEGDVFTPAGVTLDTTAGVAFSGVVATFTDVNATTPAGDLSATINWGDGSTLDAGAVNGSNGTFTVTGSHTYAAFGGPDSVTVVLKEKSPGAASATASSTALIADPNLTGSPTTLSATEGVALPTTTTVATFTDSNTNATHDGFTATIDWGDGTSSAAGQVSGGSGSFTIAGGHTYAHSGNFAVSVTVFETATPASPAAEIDSTAAVAGAAIQVTATPIGATEGSTGAFTNKQVATFTDANASLLSTDFTATIDWGDGTTSSLGNVTGGNGTFTVTGGHEYAEEHPGTQALTMKVTIVENAPLGTTASATASATVAEGDTLTSPNGAALTTSEGATFNGAVAIFTDSNLDAIPQGFTAVINWGDGTTDAGSVTGGSGTFTVSGSHTYAFDGFFALAVNLVDRAPGIAEGVATGTATVNEDAGFAITASTLTGTEGTSLSAVTVATFTDAGSTQPSTHYSATIDWGDGTSSTGGSVNGSNGAYTVTGTHAYASEGTFHPVVTITEQNSPATISATGTATMADADVLTATGATITPTQNSPFTGTVATFTDAFAGAVAADFTATIDWGDGSSTSTGAVTLAGGTFTVSGTHTYAASGSQSIHVVIKDTNGTASATATSTANLVVSTLTAVGVPVSVPTGTTVSNATVATFTDSDAGLPASNYSATIDWGDGTSSTGTIAASGSTFIVTGSHVYAEPKLWSLTITVTPTNGTAATATAAATVGSGTERFVGQLYHDLLGRQGETQGVQYWTDLIDTGNARGIEVLNIEHTDEFRKVTVQGLYRLYLHRGADPTSLGYFDNYLISGATPEQIAANLASSTEYFQSRGGGTANGFLDALYGDIVHRPAGAAAQAAFASKDPTNSAVRAQAAAAVFASAEYLSQLISFPQPHDNNPFADQAVHGFYQTYLHRDADAAALNHYLGMLQSGQRDDVVASQIIGSAEYGARL